MTKMAPHGESGTSERSEPFPFRTFRVGELPSSPSQQDKQRGLALGLSPFVPVLCFLRRRMGPDTREGSKRPQAKFDRS